MRRVALALSVATLLPLVAAMAVASDPAATPPKPPPKPPPAGLLHEVTYTTTVPAQAAGTKRVEIWLPVPFEDDTQRVLCLKVKADVPWELTRDRVHGNRMLHAVVEAPTGPVTLVWTAIVDRDQDAGQGGGAVLPSHLASDARAAVDGKATAIAKELGVDAADQPVRLRAQRIYEYVLATMVYDKVTPGWGAGDFTRACDVGRGNCSDFAAKFIAIARAAGVPARWVSAISVAADHVGCSACGYHCYAQFREGDRWFPADASDARKVLETDPAKAKWFFGNAEATSVVLSVGRDLELAPKQQGPAVNYLGGPYVEVDGKPFAVPADHRKYDSKVLEETPRAPKQARPGRP